MITVCPTCALTLAVTASDLRVGQGQVRCGRCAAVFNALAALPDDLTETIEQPRPPDLRAAPGAAEAPEVQAPAVADSTAAAIQIDDPPEPVVGFPPAANDAEALAPQPANDDDMDPVAANDEIEVDVESVVATPRLDDSDEPIVQHEDIGAATPAALDLDLTPVAPARMPWRWLAASAVLLLALGAQWIHWNRETLVLHDSLRGPVTSVYAAFGQKIQPRWDPAQFEVRRLGEMIADEEGRMTLRATVRNLAVNSQPLPLLRIVLLDRFGARVAARDLQPREYLPAKIAAGLPQLAAGQRVDAEVTLSDPGPTASGFELDACLDLGSGVLRCASTSPAM
jgi:predicted Zn finger-like uncharacterized protein